MWIIDYEEDIESDLSAFHRIDDPMALDGPRYFRLAVRLSAYAGVLAARAEKLRQEESDGGATSQSAARGGVQRVHETAAIASLSDGWVEHVKTEEG